jgi:hypothetical protein
MYSQSVMNVSGMPEGTHVIATERVCDEQQSQEPLCQLQQQPADFAVLLEPPRPTCWASTLAALHRCNRRGIVVLPARFDNATY